MQLESKQPVELVIVTADTDGQHILKPGQDARMQRAEQALEGQIA